MKKSENTKSLQVGSTPNPLARPNHKRHLIEARLNAEESRRRPEPMTLMHKREKFLHLEPEGKPDHTAGTVDKAARAIADWDLSDPFAYGRTALHVRQGFLDPKEITEDYYKRTVARRVARAREVEREKSTPAA